MKPNVTDHDRCIQIILDYIKSKPTTFELLKVNVGVEQGPDLLFVNGKQNCIEYVEVELDAKESRKAVRMAKRASEFHHRYNKPVRVWMVSSSNEWVTSQKKTGVADNINAQLLGNQAIKVFRISPIDLGIFSLTRDFPFES